MRAESEQRGAGGAGESTVRDRVGGEGGAAEDGEETDDAGDDATIVAAIQVLSISWRTRSAARRSAGAADRGR